MPPVELKPLPGPAPTLSPLPLPLPFPLLAAAAAAAAALCEDAVMPRKRQPLGSSETVQDMLQAIEMLDEQKPPPGQKHTKLATLTCPLQVQVDVGVWRWRWRSCHSWRWRCCRC